MHGELLRPNAGSGWRTGWGQPGPLGWGLGRLLLQLQRLHLDPEAVAMAGCNSNVSWQQEGNQDDGRSILRKTRTTARGPLQPSQGHPRSTSTATPTLSPAQGHLPQRPSATLFCPLSPLSGPGFSLSQLHTFGPSFSAKVIEAPGGI